MIDVATTVAGLKRAGFSQAHQTTKVLKFRRVNEIIYVKIVGTDHPLVIHGNYASRLPSLLALPGVYREKANADAYHNAHMRAFDQRQNRGMKPTRFGYDFGFSDGSALDRFLISL